MQKFMEVYQDLSFSTLDRLAEIYANDVRFIDPAHEIVGLDRLKEYFAGLYRNISSPQFRFTHHLRSADNAYVQWEMEFSHRQLNSGRTITVSGASYLKFNDVDSITFHRDYFDLGAMFYEHIPLLGRIISKLKRRLAS